MSRIVADRLAVADLIARYNIAGDRGRVEEFLELFAEDATVRTPVWSATGRAAILDALRGIGRPSFFKTAAPRIMRHHLTTVLIEIESERRAKSRSYFLNISEAGADHSGVYVDEFLRSPDGWRFMRRDIRVDWQATDSLYVPLLRGNANLGSATPE